MTRLYIAGTGNVSKALLQLLEAIPEIEIYGLENSRGSIYGYGPLDKQMINLFLEQPSRHQKPERVEDLEFDIYVDLRTASKDGILEWRTYEHMFYSGKSVVTANKSGLANFFPEIMKDSISTKRKIFYEATVAGGLPIFSLLEGSFKPFHVKEFVGIVNLTSNFVLKKIRSGLKQEDAFNEAVKAGVAETDMSDDLNGTDSARKAVIIANSIFGYPLRLSNLKYTGIDLKNISGKTALMVRINDEGEISSGLMELEEGSAFLDLDPMSMAVQVSFKEREPIFVSEKRDGPIETAGAVLNDILRCIS